MASAIFLLLFGFALQVTFNADLVQSQFIGSQQSGLSITYDIGKFNAICTKALEFSI